MGGVRPAEQYGVWVPPGKARDRGLLRDHLAPGVGVVRWDRTAHHAEHSLEEIETAVCVCVFLHVLCISCP